MNEDYVKLTNKKVTFIDTDDKVKENCIVANIDWDLGATIHDCLGNEIYCTNRKDEMTRWNSRYRANNAEIDRDMRWIAYGIKTGTIDARQDPSRLRGRLATYAVNGAICAFK